MFYPLMYSFANAISIQLLLSWSALAHVWRILYECPKNFGSKWNIQLVAMVSSGFENKVCIICCYGPQHEAFIVPCFPNLPHAFSILLTLSLNYAHVMALGSLFFASEKQCRRFFLFLF